MHLVFRPLLLCLLLAVPARAQEALRDVRRARTLLGDDVWARVLRIGNTARHSAYPVTSYALVFEFNGALWFYAPYNGTQSLSLYLNRVEQDKTDLAPLLREIEAGFTRFEVLADEMVAGMPDARMPPHACFIESVAALRVAVITRPDLIHAALLSYYVGPRARAGHTVLALETRRGVQVIDPTDPRERQPLPASLSNAALAVARTAFRGERVTAAQWIRIAPTQLAALAAASRHQPAPGSIS